MTQQQALILRSNEYDRHAVTEALSSANSGLPGHIRILGYDATEYCEACDNTDRGCFVVRITHMRHWLCDVCCDRYLNAPVWDRV